MLEEQRAQAILISLICLDAYEAVILAVPRVQVRLRLEHELTLVQSHSEVLEQWRQLLARLAALHYEALVSFLLVAVYRGIGLHNHPLQLDKLSFRYLYVNVARVDVGHLRLG